MPFRPSTGAVRRFVSVVYHCSLLQVSPFKKSSITFANFVASEKLERLGVFPGYIINF